MNDYRFNPKRFLEACRGVAVLVLLAFLLGLTADGPTWFVLIGTFGIGVAVAEALRQLIRRMT